MNIRLKKFFNKTTLRILGVLATLLCIPAVQSAPMDKISINGYLSVEYEQNISGDDEGDANGSFDMDLIDIVFNIQATDKLRIATDFTWEHGAASEDGRGNVAVEYAFAEYSIFGDLAKIRAGKMFTNFGIYNEIHTAKPATLTVKEPQSTNKNNKFGSEIRFYPRWLTGLAVVGNYHSWNYVLQVSNGETEDDDFNPYEEDDNGHKAINGRVRYKPIDALRLGVSFYRDSMEDPDSTERLDISSYGFQVEWENDGGTGLEFEFVRGNENRKARTNIKRRAYTAMAYQRLGDRYTPYFRYEHLEPDTDIPDDEGSVSILGVNILIDENMYLKFELDKFSTGDRNDRYKGASFTEFKSSLSIGF